MYICNDLGKRSNQFTNYDKTKKMALNSQTVRAKEPSHSQTSGPNIKTIQTMNQQ